MPDIEERVSKLGTLLEEFITSVKEQQIQTEIELRALKEEMGAFKEEVRQDRIEMNKRGKRLPIRWGHLLRIGLHLISKVL